MAKIHPVMTEPPPDETRSLSIAEWLDEQVVAVACRPNPDAPVKVIVLLAIRGMPEPGVPAVVSLEST